MKIDGTVGERDNEYERMKKVSERLLNEISSAAIAEQQRLSALYYLKMMGMLLEEWSLRKTMYPSGGDRSRLLPKEASGIRFLEVKMWTFKKFIGNLYRLA